ncbi:hypothetical protein ACFSTC_62260 [Nonomuraea ferruginea]
MRSTARPRSAFFVRASTFTRGAIDATADSTASANSSGSPATPAKSGSGWKLSGLPAARLGVQTTTSVPAR